MGQSSPYELQTGFQSRIPLQTQIGQGKYGIPLPEGEIGWARTDLERRISAIEAEVSKLRKGFLGPVRINTLPNKTLNASLDVILEADGDGFIARTVDLLLYGSGDDPIEALEMLKREIESLYDDLKEGNDFSDEWLKIKSYLSKLISD